MVDKFKNAMLTSGIVCREDIIADGQIHRFSNHGKGKKDGWYVYHDMAGAFGDWSRDIQGKWSLKAESLPSQAREHLVEKIEKAKQDAEEERLRKYEETATLSLEKWDTLSETGTSPYLLKKKVEAFGVRFRNDILVVPLKDIAGKLWSLQWINPDGSKRFLTGGRKKGSFHSIGVLEDGKPIIVVEGYATGASLYMATHQAVVVAFDAGNIEPVLEELKKAYPKSPIIIAGDDDNWKDINTGRTTAEAVALKHGCSIVFPSFKNTETKPTDFNDLYVLEGLAVVKSQIHSTPQKKTLKAINIRDLLSWDIKPREMLLNPIIPEQGLTMIHAPRGVGKTHISLLIAYSVATGIPMFHGRWEAFKSHKVL
ncbi:MAG TPA: toprim domain-containing protein, partial [Alphaproteobacteria bacterium]|nr:toprim domain-containing protein [Alphaproteobacteria bacterium]